MKLEELIYKRFVDSAGLTRHLTVYSGLPAIFSPEAPDDSQPGWDGRTLYPMVLYSFDMQANQERKSAGVLSVSLLCQNMAPVTPEEIEPEVKKCLRDVLLLPDRGPAYAFAWARTDAFTMQEKKKDLVLGSEIRFDILEYASQETTDPDPIMAMHQYVKALSPDCVVIGHDRMEPITEASGEAPVVYCRLLSVEKNRETNTVVWMDGRIAIHILCPDSEVRMKMAAAIANQLSLEGEVIMLDKSPMFIKRLQVDYQADYLKSGQIFATVHYGLLRYKAKPHALQQAKGNYV
ncbi:MAG: hypothetical protein HFI33_15370 [Lachnospiraceae bacterium]|nr:hypothetical protein [Lachnospiraceae bacterium]